MENASKALIMAGGVLLTMLIIALIVFARGKFGDFFNKEDSLAEIVDISEFNLQFTNYDRDDVHGYELISLANKVADYNMRFSNTNGAMNDQKYNPIKMTISLNGQADKLRFEVIGRNGQKISSQNANSYFINYNNRIIEQSTIRNEILQIIQNATGIANNYGNDQTATKLAKSINSLILTQEQLEYNKVSKNWTEETSEQVALDNYNSIATDNKKSTYSEMVTELTSSTGNIMKYYEYYQFKKAIFKCTAISYDNVSSRVSTINFEFTGEIE